MKERRPPALDRLPRHLREALEASVAEIVRAAEPERLILFGSHAHGQAREDSDIDLLVVARTNNRWRLASRLYLLWHNCRQRYPALPPADIIVLTPRQFAEGAELIGFIPYEAQRTGVILYERPHERTKMAQ